MNADIAQMDDATLWQWLQELLPDIATLLKFLAMSNLSIPDAQAMLTDLGSTPEQIHNFTRIITFLRS